MCFIRPHLTFHTSNCSCKYQIKNVALFLEYQNISIDLNIWRSYIHFGGKFVTVDTLNVCNTFQCLVFFLYVCCNILEYFYFLFAMRQKGSLHTFRESIHRKTVAIVPAEIQPNNSKRRTKTFRLKMQNTFSQTLLEVLLYFA